MMVCFRLEKIVSNRKKLKIVKVLDNYRLACPMSFFVCDEINCLLTHCFFNQLTHDFKDNKMMMLIKQIELNQHKSLSHL